jgi:hypothetical protein
MLFAILQTLLLWGINPRHWLTRYRSSEKDSVLQVIVPMN